MPDHSNVRRQVAVRDAEPPYQSAHATPDDVPPGCKRTEVGVIPEDWEIRAVKDLGKVKTGPFGTSLKASEYSKYGGVPLISVGEIREGFLQVSENTPRVPPEVVRRLPQYILKKGDIVFGRKGGVDRSSPIGDQEDGWFLGSDGIVIRPSANYCSEFLAAQFRSTRVQNWLLQNSIGTTMASLNQGILQSVIIPLPANHDEQCAIATALSDVDALLEGLDRLINKKADVKRAAMQQLLTGQIRLPGFVGEWKETALGHLAEIRSGGTPSTTNPEFWNGGIAWCTPTDITAMRGRKYLTETERTISHAGLRASSAEVIPANSIIMTTRATIGECAINTVPITTNQGFKNLIPTAANAEFLYYLMTTQKERLLQLCGGSTFLEVGKKQLQRFELNVPLDIDEQRAIATILSGIDGEIEGLEQRRAKTADLKRAMMQELLTGKTRLAEPQIAASSTKSASDHTKGHSWAFNEAVVIATLARRYGKEDYPLGRKRYTKLSYLLHRRAERQVDGYLKKAAGPYNPKTRYGGPEMIALQNGYVREHEAGKYRGFIAADQIDKAEHYFEKWYGPDALHWLDQFRFNTNDELEVLTTVDMAAQELRACGKKVEVGAVKGVIRRDPQWKAKLNRAVFSDNNIANAIKQSEEALTGLDVVELSHA